MGNSVQFTLESYIETEKLSKVRSSLMTKYVSNANFKRLLSNIEDELFNSDDYFEEVNHDAPSNPEALGDLHENEIKSMSQGKGQRKEKKDKAEDCMEMEDMLPNQARIRSVSPRPDAELPIYISDDEPEGKIAKCDEKGDGNLHLIGSSAEREQLRNEIEKVVKESEELDRLKEERKRHLEKQDKKSKERKLHLQAMRKSRLSLEPGLEEEHYVISVRHPEFGLVTRLFKPNDTMSAAYDYIGSLSPDPEFFHLCKYPRKVTDPTENVSKVNDLLFLEVKDTPVILGEDQEISLPGFGTLEPSSLEQTLPYVDVHQVHLDDQPSEERDDTSLLSSTNDVLEIKI